MTMQRAFLTFKLPHWLGKFLLDMKNNDKVHKHIIGGYLTYTTPWTTGFTSHPKDEAMVKGLA